MNKAPLKVRVQILQMLCEGSSMRSISRVTGVSINTVSKLLVDAGNACAAFHDGVVRGVKAKEIQADEVWSFTCAKAKNVPTAKSVPEEAGDTWTWTAIDADSKLIVSYLVGGHDADYASAFMNDLASRLANRVRLTTDGHRANLEVVEGAFGADVDYAQLVKLYGEPKGEAQERYYSPGECCGTRKDVIEGDPDKKKISTTYVERSNLSLRMHNRRFTRLTNAFSKKFENHVHMVSLYTVYYNFVRIHKSLKVTPAMAAGVTDKLLEMEDIVKLINDVAPKPGRPKTYKKRREA
jgi:IS1 family transposase